jgi:hypothetical protein
LLSPQKASEPLGVGGSERAEFVIAVEQVADAALGNGDAAAGEFLMDLGYAAVLRVAQPPDEGEDVETKLMVGQSKVGLSLGSVGAMVAGATGVGAASDREG